MFTLNMDKSFLDYLLHFGVHLGEHKVALFLILTLALISARAIWLVGYRLYLSPLSKFPGPKLAAISGWHELYYDLIHKGGGQFTFEIKRMHDRYGPIVRINPNELHIDDPEFYNEVNCAATAAHPIDKIRKFKYRFNVPEATVHTVYSEHHRARRAAIAPFFSKQRVRSRNGHLQHIVDRISHRFETEYKGTGRAVNMSDVWATMTADVITELAFARSTNFSAAPDFQSPFSMAMASSVVCAHYTTHFRPMVEMMNWIPDAVLGTIVPLFKPILEYRRAISQQIHDVLAGQNMDAKETSHPTIFHDILASELPPEELSFSRLLQEAMSVNGAGIETTMWTLTVGTFHVINNPNVYRRLKDELTVAMPDRDVILPWESLEALPYLSAVVQESLRLAFGSVQRLPRVSRLEPLIYGGWTIPPNVSVSMDAYHNHINPAYFPDPLKFVPERWLNDPKGPDGLHPLGNYMVSFSRGARNCVGMTLALMELHVCLATIFRRHELELYHTTRDDVDFIIDLVKPMPKRGSKGVRVIVKS